MQKMYADVLKALGDADSDEALVAGRTRVDNGIWSKLRRTAILYSGPSQQALVSWAEAGDQLYVWFWDNDRMEESACNIPPRYEVASLLFGTIKVQRA